MSKDFLNSLTNLIDDEIVRINPLKYYILSHFIPFPFIFSDFLKVKSKDITEQYCYRLDIILKGKRRILYSPKENLEIFYIPRRKTKIDINKIEEFKRYDEIQELKKRIIILHL